MTAFSILNSGLLETFVLELLLDIQSKHPKIIDPSVDVLEGMGISRSFRRGATTWVSAMQTSKPRINGRSLKQHKEEDQ
jgi:hypothetical protein